MIDLSLVLFYLRLWLFIWGQIMLIIWQNLCCGYLMADFYVANFYDMSHWCDVQFSIALYTYRTFIFLLFIGFFLHDIKYVVIQKNMREKKIMYNLGKIYKCEVNKDMDTWQERKNSISYGLTVVKATYIEAHTGDIIQRHVPIHT
jgi:hypothetical protein